jgi:uncharacterized membrane protein YeaQ/YmgE (transglycosylase-associated protein family)
MADELAAGRRSPYTSPMSFISLLVLLAIAGVCGAIGQSLAGYSRGGCVASIALGFIGALLGSWLAHALHLPELVAFQIGRESFPILWSVIGSALFVAFLGLLRRD